VLLVIVSVVVLPLGLSVMTDPAPAAVDNWATVWLVGPPFCRPNRTCRRS